MIPFGVSRLILFGVLVCDPIEAASIFYVYVRTYVRILRRVGAGCLSGIDVRSLRGFDVGSLLGFWVWFIPGYDGRFLSGCPRLACVIPFRVGGVIPTRLLCVIPFRTFQGLVCVIPFRV